jgi:sirohydrochlorin ferrochelatase
MASPVLRLLIEPLDLGPDVRAISLDLAEEGAEDPARGPEADAVWAAAIPALAGTETWSLDFTSHLDRLRDFCQAHAIDFREAAARSIVVPSMEQEDLLALITRFEGETFGLRVGGPLATDAPADSVLENELSKRGLDAYHQAYVRYSLCGICDFENGSLTLLTTKLSSSEALRRLRPALTPLGARVDRPE